MLKNTMKIQRCNSYGDEISDSEEDIESNKYKCIECIFRHKCIIKNHVFYFRNLEESKSWDTYIDENNKTRCLYCHGLFPISLHTQ